MAHIYKITNKINWKIYIRQIIQKNGYNETPGGAGRPKDYPEKEICNFYLLDSNLSKTGLKFNISRDTVKRILERNNIMQSEIIEIQIILAMYAKVKEKLVRVINGNMFNYSIAN